MKREIMFLKAVLWDITPCNLVEITIMMEAVSTSETSVIFCHTPWHNIREDSRLPTRRVRTKNLSKFTAPPKIK
jgi:hypothetical protein